MQYEAVALDSYVGNGEKWGLNGVHSFTATLTPRQTEDSAKWYKGTADAITQNIDFIDAQNPDYVLILSGDHIYKTLYNEMVDLHINSEADATISVIEVDPSEASRFGIMAVDKNDRIIEFQEKPKVPKSNLASMGIYVFTWKTLRSYLKEDEKDDDSDHDFGKNIIPTMLAKGNKLQAYRFQGYWKDVGTLASLHQANMDIALDNRELNLFEADDSTKIYSEDTHSVPQYVGTKGSIKRSIANQGAIILGSVDSCVISNEVIIEEGAECTRCVIMAGARIKKGAKVHNAIVAPDAVIGEKQEINLDKADVILVSGGSYK